MGRANAYAPSVKAAAIATALTLGPQTAGRAAGLPAETARRWAHEYRENELDPALVAEVDRIVAEIDGEARQTMARVVAKGVALIEHALDKWSEKPDQLTPNQLKDLALVVGIVQDKKQLLEGKPSSLSAHMSLHRTERVSTPYADEIRRECDDGQ